MKDEALGDASDLVEDPTIFTRSGNSCGEDIIRFATRLMMTMTTSILLEGISPNTIASPPSL